MFVPLQETLSAASGEGRALHLQTRCLPTEGFSTAPHTIVPLLMYTSNLVSAVLCYIRLPWAYPLLCLHGQIAAIQNPQPGFNKCVRCTFFLGGGTCSHENVRRTQAVFRMNSCKCQNTSWHLLWTVYHYQEGNYTVRQTLKGQKQTRNVSEQLPSERPSLSSNTVQPIC